MYSVYSLKAKQRIIPNLRVIFIKKFGGPCSGILPTFPTNWKRPKRDGLNFSLYEYLLRMIFISALLGGPLPQIKGRIHRNFPARFPTFQVLVRNTTDRGPELITAVENGRLPEKRDAIFRPLPLCVLRGKLWHYFFLWVVMMLLFFENDGFYGCCLVPKYHGF